MQLDSKQQIFLHDEHEYHYSFQDIDGYRIGFFISRNKEKTFQENEDTLFIQKNEQELIFGVADGAGGHPRGRDAAFLIGNELISTDRTDHVYHIDDLNKKIIDLKVGAKSTLAFAAIKEDLIRFYTVGDSEIIYWNGHGNEIFTSTPHSNSGLKVRAGITSQTDSLDDPDRYLVNNLMGDEFIRIESTSGVPIKKGHTILIGSDGLFDNISHEDLTEIVGRGSFDKSFQGLVDLCIEQDPERWLKNDDITFIFLRKIKA
ncbi:PP2C family serine/threonine-protein phosphatase [Halobacteriovorax sp. HLS]|uniref:PP2C family protein-serine/threonine phosphatase n=1 Tax=Halobacteriovorax sp. HLS TaxID=2234000 RepID=UPI000FD6BD76|nr:protein phosphatase 2C domain-containing protein [Halobacteriovorax sp. HLS]